jgi:hypothetical protein
VSPLTLESFLYPPAPALPTPTKWGRLIDSGGAALLLPSKGIFLIVNQSGVSGAQRRIPLTFPFFLGSAFLYPRTCVQPYLQGYILGAVLYP